MLLERTFPGAKLQMVSVVIKPEGTGRFNEFSRTNEFLFFVFIGAIRLSATADDMAGTVRTAEQPVEWRNLRRRERESVRASRPRQFYAVFVDTRRGTIHSVGDAITPDVDRQSIVPPAGTTAVFPLAPSGTEMIWSLIPESLRKLVDSGFARYSSGGIQFLNAGTVAAIERGEIAVLGRDARGIANVAYVTAKTVIPKSAWSRDSHNSQTHGMLMLARLLPGRIFPFPKSLYAVEDAIRFFVANKPEATVLDFFAGSGTTAHAVARLNRQDGGRRQAIVVTNNEVSAEEVKSLTAQGFCDGDPEWEALGIFEYITGPRITAAVTGSTPDGEPVKGDYKFVDEFPMAEGFNENVEFLKLTYQDPLAVELDTAFEAVAPLLWLRAGGQGPVIETRSAAWDVTERYGILFDPDQWRTFLDALTASVRTVFVVTDSDSVFTGVAGAIPGDVDVVRLYENYLSTFTINRAG